MADETVLCRRKDNHETTHVIPVAALGYFPDWEPVPDEQDAGPGGAEGGSPAVPDAAPKADTKTIRKTDSKGRE